LQLSRGGEIETIKGRKRQELLALLVGAKLSGRTEVSRLELLSTLYPNDDELRASNSLKGLIHALRETLGTNALLTTPNGYALGTLETDAENFLKTGNPRLWRGVYLEGLELETRETVSNSLYLLLFEKAQTLLTTDPKEAVRVAKILLEADPYNQTYLKLCLQALRATSNHKSLSRLYTEARAKLAEVGEKLPENWQGFLSP
jgi:two-component SAPR family response regulator